MTGNQSHGFTLMKLAVVIVVITILILLSGIRQSNLGGELILARVVTRTTGLLAVLF